MIPTALGRNSGNNETVTACRHGIRKGWEMSEFRKAFEAGQNAVEKKRTMLLYAVLALMALSAAVRELLARNYILAVLALVFFLVVMPWLGKAWLRPDENGQKK